MIEYLARTLFQGRQFWELLWLRQWLVEVEVVSGRDIAGMMQQSSISCGWQPI